MSGGFTSTRGGPAVPLEAALFRGLAPDGGLYVPAEPPRLRWPPSMQSLPEEDLRAVAGWAAPRLFPSVDAEVLRSVVESALDFPVRLVDVEPGVRVLELFHGPTHAFKDVGARFMAFLMAELGGFAERRRTVLVATSGDTGGAVASAFHGMPGCRVVILFPATGVSERQRRQMTTLGGNVQAVAVRGTFDDCQRMAKEAFRDEGLSERHGLTSANSINVGRLLPQTFYYLHAAALLHARRGVVGPRFVVPSGNLGNLCAGLIAHRAGMPASGFTAATNENRGFVDYLEGAPFEPRPSRPTTSTAMDVGDPSNLERIRWLYGGDDGAVRRAVDGVAVHQSEVVRCITELHGTTGYILDPHTAVAYVAAKRQNDTGEPIVVLATAHPAKFPETVEEAIGSSVEPPPGLRAVYDREEEIRAIGPRLSELENLLRASWP